METATESAPVVSTVTESSQESKVEKVANGTVESSVSTEKTVSQSVQVQGDQTVQQKRYAKAKLTLALVNSMELFLASSRK